MAERRMEHRPMTLGDVDIAEIEVHSSLLYRPIITACAVSTKLLYKRCVLNRKKAIFDPP